MSVLLKRYRQRILLLLVGTTGGAAAVSVAYAQDGRSEPGSVIEEVVVTARKREESLQETPIAVSAFGGNDLRERGIANIQELSRIVPSLQINEGQSNQIYIRGVGERTGFDRIDPAVGVYLDDIYLPRTEGQLLDTVDIQNVQVLRGPQGTLFGKNTTGGALALTLAKPNASREGYVEASLGNFEERSAKAVINVPLSETFYTRFALHVRKNEGFLEDIATGKNNTSSDRKSVILQQRWDATENFTLDTFLFYGEIRDRLPGSTCKVADTDGLLMEGLGLLWPGDTDPSNPSAFADNCRANSRSRVGDLKTNMGPDANLDVKLDTSMLGVTADWQINENHNVKLITGIRDSDKGPVLKADTDGGPANFTESHNHDDGTGSSYTAELQWNGSLFSQRFNYTAGLFFMRETNEEPFTLMTNIVGIDSISLAALAQGERPDSDDIPPGGSNPPLVGPLAGILTQQVFELENETRAAFFQGSWDITDALQLTGGIRFTSEQRQSKLETTPTDFDAVAARISSNPLFGPEIPGTRLHPYIGPGGWSDDPVRIAAGMFADRDGDGLLDAPLDQDAKTITKGDATFRELTPMVSLSYKLPSRWIEPVLLDSTMVYATWSNGFKSGFFEPIGVDGLKRIEPETVENREIGVKIEGFDRSLRLNIAVYSMIFDDMQLIQPNLDSSGTFIVAFQNAARSKIEGVEMEASWLPIRDLMLTLSYSHNNYTFIDFTEPNLRTLAISGERDIVDRSDENFPASPEEQASLGVQYKWLSSVGAFIPRIDVSYQGEMFLGLDRNSWLAFKRDSDLASADDYTLVNLRFQWRNPDGDMTVAGFIKNLTDERSLNGAATVADSVGTFTETYGAPRTFGIEFRKTFDY